MIDHLPVYIPILFGLTTLLTLFFIYRILQKSTASKSPQRIGIGIIIWLLVQMVLSINLIYLHTIGNIPPLFPLVGFLPLILLMVYLFSSTAGKKFIDGLPLQELTILSVVRIPVEIVLWALFIHQMIPEAMTFEGRNFDILAGITAPFVAYAAFINGKPKRTILLAWNIIGLFLLLNIIFHAVFSFPTFMQQISFDQPNVGLLYFPYVWLPSFVAPAVLFSHLVSLRQLWGRAAF